MESEIYSIWLSLVLKPGSRLVAPLFDYYSSAEEIYMERECLPDALPLTEAERESFRKIPLSEAEEIFHECMKKGFKVIDIESAEYPERLREIYDFPLVLYRIGLPLQVDDRLSIAVVGTRHPSAYATEATRQIVHGLAQSGVTIISGLAVGIDATAHISTLEEKGYTIAVVGGGLDINYPRANEKLHFALEKVGTVISEYPPGVRPAGFHFPIRNRILSGLADGVFVSEGSMKSGTLRTASHAVEQGRDVFVLPGSIFNEKADGTFQLLKDGAAPVATALDIVENYLEKYPERIGTDKKEVFLDKKTEEKKIARNSFKKKSNSSTILSESTVVFSEMEALSKMAQRIFRNFPVQAIYIDELTVKTGLSLSELLPVLTELELMGAIISRPGRMYLRMYEPPVENESPNASDETEQQKENPERNAEKNEESGDCGVSSES